MLIQRGFMAKMTAFSTVVLLNMLIIAPATSAATRRCPAGKFLPPDALLDECRPCSVCPLNEIIRRPCTDISDTKCGPFYEFQNFNSFQDDDEEPGSDVAGDLNDLPKLPLATGVTQDDSEDGLQDTTAGLDNTVATGQKGNFIAFFPFFFCIIDTKNHLNNYIKLMVSESDEIIILLNGNFLPPSSEKPVRDVGLSDMASIGLLLNVRVCIYELLCSFSNNRARKFDS